MGHRVLPMPIRSPTESWPFPDTIFDCGSKMECFFSVLRSWVLCFDMVPNSNQNMLWLELFELGENQVWSRNLRKVRICPCPPFYWRAGSRWQIRSLRVAQCASLSNYLLSYGRPRLHYSKAATKAFKHSSSTRTFCRRRAGKAKIWFSSFLILRLVTG